MSMPPLSPPAEEPPPIAHRSASRWPGLVWAIPLAALLIVGFLGLRAFSDRGVNIVVSFKPEGGVKVGDTKVSYQGYEVGRVVKISPGKYNKTVDLTLRMDARTRNGLGRSTVFWMIGAKPEISDINSLKAAFTGVAIGISPDFTGAPTRRFVGLDESPVLPPDTPGSAFVLTGRSLGSVKRGSSIAYAGQEIGKVTKVALRGPQDFRIDIFVLKPFDTLIRPGDLFSNAAPLKLSLSGAGVEARIDSPAALLSGSIELTVPEGSERAAPSSPGANFFLYATQHDALVGQPGVQAPYTFTFSGAGGGLPEGAPVTLLGFEVGQVRSLRLIFDRSGAPMTSVVALIDPQKLGATGVSSTTAAATVRAVSDAAVRRLLTQGYRAKLSQSPPFVGGHVISLERVRGARLGTGLIPGDPPGIPTLTASGDIDDLTTQASQILAKVNALPIQAIGQDVRGITARLNALVSSPKVASSLDHLNSTLVQIDGMATEVRPQVGPLVAKLNQAADQAAGAAAAANALISGEGANPDASIPEAIRELTDTSRSIRSLADYLGRHPEALIGGKGKEK